jgi:hypothetical protein
VNVLPRRSPTAFAIVHDTDEETPIGRITGTGLLRNGSWTAETMGGQGLGHFATYKAAKLAIEAAHLASLKAAESARWRAMVRKAAALQAAE